MKIIKCHLVSLSQKPKAEEIDETVEADLGGREARCGESGAEVKNAVSYCRLIIFSPLYRRDS